MELKAKTDDGEIVSYHLTDVKWQDGSLQTDLPITRLSELFNVNHFIVSQTNPHAIPFMSKGRAVRKGMEHKKRDSPGVLSRAWSVLRFLITSEATHRFKQVSPVLCVAFPMTRDPQNPKHPTLSRKPLIIPPKPKSRNPESTTVRTGW